MTGNRDGELVTSSILDISSSQQGRGKEDMGGETYDSGGFRTGLENETRPEYTKVIVQTPQP